VVQASRPKWAALPALTGDTQKAFATKRLDVSWDDITGCGTCNAVIPDAERMGKEGSACDVHDACQKNFFCEKIQFAGDDGARTGPKDECFQGNKKLDSNGVCNEPWECDPGTDLMDCKTQDSMCISCDSESEALISVHCHRCVPSLPRSPAPAFVHRTPHTPAVRFSPLLEFRG
jgi:hypothetical protein